MRLLADPLNVVGADLEVGEGSVALIVSNHEVGEWPLEEVAVQIEPDGFHMRVDGEEFIFMTHARSQLADALGVGIRTKAPNGKPVKASKPVKPVKESKSRRKDRAEARAAKPRQSKPAKPRRQARWQLKWRDRRVQLLAGLLVAVVALGVVAPGLLTALLLFVGISGVVIAGAAILDPLLAARLPEVMTPTKWAVIGLGATASGMILLLL